MIVTNNKDNKIDTDAESLSRLILKPGNVSSLRNGGTMASFLEKDQGDIVNQMTENFRRLALSQIRSHDVVKEVQKHLGSGSPEIPNLARRSNPYQTFQSTYKSLLANPPKIIFGHDPTGKVLPNLTGKLKFTNCGDSSVDHLLFFYQEDFGFAMDDLVVFQTLKQHYDKKPGAYGHLTHQNPDFYNLELKNKTSRLTRWCKVLRRLVPEICNQINDKAFSEVFRLDYGRYVFEYNVDGLPQTLGLYDDPDGIKKLSRMENAESYEKFIQAVQSEFAMFGRDRIANKIIKPLLHKVEDIPTRNKLSEYYNRFLDEVYSGSNVTDTPDADAELDAHFSQPPRQIHQHAPTPQPDNTSTPPSQEVNNDNAAQPTADSDNYDGTASEESEIDAGSFNQSDTAHNEETSQDSASDANDDEYVWVEAEPETEHSPAEDTTGKESPAEQQPQPETGEQEKQKQPSSGFSVKNPNVKQTLQRKGTRKKE